MRATWRAAGLVAGLITASVLSVPSGAATYTTTAKTYIVPTRHGHIYAAVAHPTLNGKIVRAPQVLTYSPYNAAFGRNGDASTWVQHGISRVTADLVGTGNSGGCYDYGGKREKETAYDLVEWLAKQSWSTGKVGMIGGSYDGTTAMAAAVMRPPHLTTIIPEAAISRWYDYAYSGGMRHTFNNERMGRQDPGLIIDEQGFDTPAGFDLGFGNTPPLDVTGEQWAERTQSAMRPCDEVKHIESGYRPDPDYDAFWVERDYARDAHKVKIPVLVALNWGDWNVKQETGIRFWQAAKNSRFRRLVAGTRWEAHGTPGGFYKQLRVDWMRHFLKGAKTDIPKTPPVISQPADSKGSHDFYEGPIPKTTPVTLYAQLGEGVSGWEQVLLPSRPASAGSGVEYAITGNGTESGALANARTPGSNAAWFESPALKRDVRLFGAPKVQVWSTVQRTWVTYAVSVVDIDPAFYGNAGGQRHASETNALLGVTRGWLDTRYRNTLAKRQAWKPGSNGATVVAKPQDYVFRKGHSIGLLIMGEHLEWVLPKAYDGAPGGATVRVDTSGKTLVQLPVVGKVNVKTLF
ncbi:MAG TPA: CocE/NonD family hydrolase [Frankiaceae bacterium]|nr:CocE/NonD family hydrolase [Frankiaceae bacterium]